MKIIPNDGYIVMYLSKTLRYAKEVVLAVFIYAHVVLIIQVKNYKMMMKLLIKQSIILTQL